MDPVWFDSEERELLSLSAAARRLGISPRRLRQAVRQGDLPAYLLGLRNTYVRPAELLAWLRSQRAPSCDHARERAAEIVSEEARTEAAAG